MILFQVHGGRFINVQRHVRHENEYITPHPQTLLQIVVGHPTMFEVRL